ncbi:MAG: hypothetical protein FWG03_06720 [Clostridiales bacterium]|nr:hypothetical protein [Clostridiales bacterium]
MAIQVGIPQEAMIALTDLVDNCAEIKPGMDVLILAHKDGLYGGDNLVDEEALGWVATMIQSRGAHCSILWVDDPQKVHEWRYPPIVKGAIAGADLFINTSWQMAVEEIAEYRNHIEEAGTWMVRLFPVTAPLLMSKWAQTPYELVNMIRHVSSKPFMQADMNKFVMTDPNGTHLEGFTTGPKPRKGIPGMPYNSWRREASRYLPWPEWVHPPINCKEINGVFNFNCMLGWWSRYIGIQPEWDELISIEVKDGRMVNISGGFEADALKRFLDSMIEKVGDGIYNFDTFHFGIHPNAVVTDHQCPHPIYKRLIEHSHTSNLHVHVGSAPGNENYNFYPHITGDIRNATMKVGDMLVYDKGYLCCLEDPEVLAVAEKYPDRPGLPERY